MTDEYVVRRDPNRCPSHPGAALSDWLLDTRYKKMEIADMLGISRQQLYDILNERKPLSANIAVRVGKLLGNGPTIWLRMQSAYDAWHAQKSIDVSDIPTVSLESQEGFEPPTRQSSARNLLHE